MALQQIQLRDRKYTLDDTTLLGEGGFGQVYLGKDLGGSDVAIKCLPSTIGQREVDVVSAFVNKDDLFHILPIYNCGIDHNLGKRIVVMARGSRNLRDLMNTIVLTESKSIEILHCIVCGLIEMGELAHRDLKPENVLEHEGVWKLSDFGSAKYLQDATSINTLKGNFSPPYAAPELWENAESTKATDVYALGCIAFELFNGDRPFSAESREELRRKHLVEPPPELRASPVLQQLFTRSLAKGRDARPSLEIIRRILESPPEAAPEIDAQRLAMAGAAYVGKMADEESHRSHADERRRERERIEETGFIQLESILLRLFSCIERDLPTATRTTNGVLLGRQGIECRKLRLVGACELRQEAEWTVAAGATLLVGNRKSRKEVANLWFAKSPGSTYYRWWEMRYCSIPAANEPLVQIILGVRSLDRDFPAMIPDDRGGAFAGRYLAEPVSIDLEKTDEFIVRWRGHLANAIERELGRHC